MKFNLIAAALASTVITSSASITVEFEFKFVLDAAGNQVPQGSLWALVVDSGDNLFAGFGLDDSLYTEAAGTADTFFTTGVTNIEIGQSLGGGTVFAMGGFNSAGSANGVLADLNLGVNGLAANQEFAFYWFPDVDYNAPGSYAVGSEVGGMHSSSDEGFLFSGMVIPSDGAVAALGAYSVSSGDGNTPNTAFQAVTLIPEPSSSLLGALGAVALLRRRRVTQA